MNALQLLNVGSLRLKKRRIRSYRLDTEILLSKVLNKNREEILVNLNQKMKKNNIRMFKNLIKRRSNKEPIAYILNQKEFWSKIFYINNFTLIPRPETELMVEKLTTFFKNERLNILDIGTGSGCILISLLSELKNSKGVGIDVSKNALKIAKKNTIKHNLESKIKLVNASFEHFFYKKFDIVVSNPPYIKSGIIRTLDEDVKKFEPKIALDGGKDGLDLIRKVIYKTREILKINGRLALEIGNGQYNKVSKILQKKNFKIENTIKDYNNNIRCIISKLIN